MTVFEELRADTSDVAFHARAFGRELSIVVTIVVALTAVATLTAFHHFPGSQQAAAAPSPAGATPVSLPAGVAFLDLGHDGQPPTLACGQPLVVRYDAAGEPYDAASLVEEAGRRLAEATGVRVRIEHGGAEWDAPPSTGRVEIRVVWVPEAKDSHVLGVGGPVVVDQRTVVAGQVALASSAAWPAGFGPGSELGVVLHEMGHAMGLAHADDPARQMYPDAQPDRLPGFTVEERQALSWVATNDCTTQNGPRT